MSFNIVARGEDALLDMLASNTAPETIENGGYLTSTEAKGQLCLRSCLEVLPSVGSAVRMSFLKSIWVLAAD